MNPNGIQCSINCAYNDNSLVGYDSISLLVDHTCDSILDPLNLVGVGSNSRTLIQSLIRRNQTRIIFVLVLIGESFLGFFTACLIWIESKVPYSVIRAQSVLSATFALTSDYTKDLNSFCCRELGFFCRGFKDEFSSQFLGLKLVFGKEKNKGNGLCLLIG